MLVTQTIKISLGLALLIGASVFLFETETVIIESVESKTIEGKPVYNKIWLEKSGSKDIWRMNQSHKGIDAEHGDWEELKIIVDKSKTPNEVSYEQLKDGKITNYRASCFLCHSNGPRAIRPNVSSEVAPLSITNKLSILLYNFKIKTYGVVKTVDKIKSEVPLKYSDKFEMAQLKVKTCLYCHNTDGIFSRGPLLRQHADTIRHLVETEQMPPWPFKLSPKEKKEIEIFLSGL